MLKRQSFRVLASFVAVCLPLCAGSAWAASITAGTTVAGPVLNCLLNDNNAVGSNASASISQGDCDTSSGYAGSFVSMGTAQASYSVLRATAGVVWEGLARPASAPNRGSVISQARSEDALVIDVPGRTGEVVDLSFDIALGGSSAAAITASSGDPFGEANARLNVTMNGLTVSYTQISNSRSPTTKDYTGPGTVSITLGEEFIVFGQLTVRAALDDFGSRGITNAFGNATASFGNSGGITSLALFDAGGAPIEAFSLSSESGEFGLYTPVPEPGTALLIGAALTCLGAAMRRH